MSQLVIGFLVGICVSQSVWIWWLLKTRKTPPLRLEEWTEGVAAELVRAGGGQTLVAMGEAECAEMMDWWQPERALTLVPHGWTVAMIPAGKAHLYLSIEPVDSLEGTP